MMLTSRYFVNSRRSCAAVKDNALRGEPPIQRAVVSGIRCSSCASHTSPVRGLHTRMTNSGFEASPFRSWRSRHGPASQHGPGCRALRDRTGRRRNARHASEAGLANAAGRGRYCSQQKGPVKRDRRCSCRALGISRPRGASLALRFPTAGASVFACRPATVLGWLNGVTRALWRLIPSEAARLYFPLTRCLGIRKLTLRARRRARCGR
jgi:hypothetical protein